MGVRRKLVDTYLFRGRQKLRAKLTVTTESLGALPLTSVPVLSRILQSDAVQLVNTECANRIAGATGALTIGGSALGASALGGQALGGAALVAGKQALAVLAAAGMTTTVSLAVAVQVFSNSPPLTPVEDIPQTQANTSLVEEGLYALESSVSLPPEDSMTVIPPVSVVSSFQEEAAPPPPLASAAMPPAPTPPAPIALEGRVVFVDTAGTPVPLAQAYTQGIQVSLWQGERLLARGETDGQGAYALVAEDYAPDSDLWVELTAPETGRLTVLGGAALPLDAAQAATLPDLYITDTLPPAGSIGFVAPSAEQDREFISPTGAALTYFDHTHCVVVWQVLEAQAVLAQGEGGLLDIAALELFPSPNGSWYMVRFIITDLAGNQTRLEREFLLFA